MVHMHIWPKPSGNEFVDDSADPIAEIDFEEFDHQPDMGSDDGYFQYQGTDPLTGNHFELRIGDTLIKKLAKELEHG